MISSGTYVPKEFWIWNFQSPTARVKTSLLFSLEDADLHAAASDDWQDLSRSFWLIRRTKVPLSSILICRQCSQTLLCNYIAIR